MSNLRTDEIGFFRRLTKIGTDENKAIYRTQYKSCLLMLQIITFENASVTYINLCTPAGPASGKQPPAVPSPSHRSPATTPGITISSHFINKITNITMTLSNVITVL